jgi:hypothetical protein
MGSEVLPHQTHPRGFWGADLQQVSALIGPGPSGPVLCDRHRPRAIERLRAPADGRRPLPLLRVIHFLRLPWGSWERLPGLLAQRHGLFIQA